MSNIECKQRLERDLAAFEKHVEKQRQLYVSKIAYLAEEEKQQFPFLDWLEQHPEQVVVSETEDIVFSSSGGEYKMHCFWIEKATNQTLWWPSFATQRPYYVCGADVRARLEKIKLQK
jgi:hypothetical protein